MAEHSACLAQLQQLGRLDGAREIQIKYFEHFAQFLEPLESRAAASLGQLCHTPHTLYAAMHYVQYTLCAAPHCICLEILCVLVTRTMLWKASASELLGGQQPEHTLPRHYQHHTTSTSHSSRWHRTVDPMEPASAPSSAPSLSCCRLCSVTVLRQLPFTVLQILTE